MVFLIRSMMKGTILGTVGADSKDNAAQKLGLESRIAEDRCESRYFVPGLPHRIYLQDLAEIHSPEEIYLYLKDRSGMHEIGPEILKLRVKDLRD